MSSPVSASAGGRFPLSVHSPVARLVPQPLIRPSPVTRLRPTQLLVLLPRLPGSHPSLNRFIATWLPSSFLPGPTTRPEGLLAGWIIPLPNPLPPRELGWPSDSETSLAGCPSVRHRSSSSVWRALSGTHVACANSTSQVKRYF